jgi:LTXXQ motif family protein
MLRLATAALAALFVSTSPAAFAQTPSAGAAERLSAADITSLTDARINLIKTALQLTPDQEKHWPAVEAAIRARAKDRQTRIERDVRTVGERRENPIEAIRDRNPVEFMERRADTLNQRSTDLKKLADAWQPLYQTLSAEQKKRLGVLAMYVVREMRTNAEDRRLRSEDDNTE